MDSGGESAVDRGSRRVAGIDLGGPGWRRLVERERLVARLRGTDTPLALLHAPAGYGKSVLLAQWSRLDSRPFASVTLTRSHNDPAVLVASVIEALAAVEPLPDAVAAAIRTAQPNLDVVVPRLEAGLRARRLDSVLVLDELEHLRSDASLRVLEAIMAGVEGGSRLAMATRRTPPIHAARLQAARRLISFGASDLVMTPGEARQVLAEAGLDAPEPEVEAILAKTEGWPVALYLAGLSGRSRSEPRLPEAGLGGEEGNLVDYMREELIATAAPEDVDFLVRASVLDRLSGPLCDELLGVGDSGSRLAELSRENLLLIPLDQHDEWFRMHSLLAEMLRAELRRRHGGEVGELNGRASRWWESAGDPDRAVRFALEAAEFARAGRLIWEAVPAFNTTGRYATIQHWIEEIGLERAARDPHLSLTVAHGLLAEGDGGGAEYWGEVARPLLAGPGDAADDLEAGMAMLDAALGRGGTAQMAASAALARTSLDHDSPWAAMASLVAGLAAHLGGEREKARRELADGARRAAVWNVPLIQVLALAQLALLHASEGDWQSARILSSQARAQVDRSGLIARPSIVLAVAVSAYVAAADGRREEARSDLRTGRKLLARLREFAPWFEVETASALAAAATELKAPGVAVELLAQARAKLARQPDAPMLDAWVASIGEANAALESAGVAGLTGAELRVLRLLPSHLSHRQIAAELIVSPNTVKTQMRSVYRKLGVSSRHEAVEVCLSLGLSPNRGDSYPVTRE
ncbi:MAG: AAA family ATPase [Actinobacteria bacterium]|nr:AAA family ATPase [Actinomycetota bacterium]